MTKVTVSLTAVVTVPGAVEVVSPDAAAAGGGGSGAAAEAGATTPVVQVEVQAAPQTGQLGVVSVTVPAETATVGAGFVFTLPTDLVAQFNTQVRVSLDDRSPLPAWLKFDVSRGEFTATAVPGRAWPCFSSALAARLVRQSVAGGDF